MTSTQAAWLTLGALLALVVFGLTAGYKALKAEFTIEAPELRRPRLPTPRRVPGRTTQCEGDRPAVPRLNP